MISNERIFERVDKILSILDGTDVSEIEVENNFEKVKIVMTPSAMEAGDDTEYAEPMPPVNGEGQVEVFSSIYVKSPFVGVFHRTGNDGKPLVNVGDVIDKGALIGYVSTMNIRNNVVSEVKGKVVSILVEDNHGVEYGQPILTVEP